MAPKNTSRFIDNPPSASPSQDHEQEESEEEEVVESEEEGEESEQEEEEEGKNPQNTKKKSQTQRTTKPSSPSAEEEEEEEEGSDDDGDDDSDDNTKSSPTASDFTIKPIVHANKNQQQSKPNPKRVLELKKDDEKKDSTRKKAKVVQEETKRVVGNSGGGNVGRLWSEDDEIAVLEGMIDYQSQKGADPQADMGAFHEFVKGRFGFDVTKTQLYEKVRRFKKKFFTNMEKVGASGQDPVFSKPHELNCFELSKKIWGSSNGTHSGVSNGVDENVKSTEGKAKKSGKVKSSEMKSKGDDRKKREYEKKKDDVEVEGVKKKEDDEKMIVEKEVMKDELVKFDGEDFSEKYPNLSASFDVETFSRTEGVRKFLKKNVSLIGNEKASELEENWKRLRMEEIELFCKRSKLMIEQTRLVMDAMKKR